MTVSESQSKYEREQEFSTVLWFVGALLVQIVAISVLVISVMLFIR